MGKILHHFRRHWMSARRVKSRLNKSLKRQIQKGELDSVGKMGMITLVMRPNFTGQLICVTRTNEWMRICLDTNDKTILWPHFVTPLFEEDISKLHGEKWFTIVDIKLGYWQMKLINKSRQSTTFITQFGSYMSNSQWELKVLKMNFNTPCSRTLGTSRMFYP